MDLPLNQTGRWSDNGMTDVAYTLLFQRKNPSWLYSVDNGATTIWERWNSYMKENGMGPNGMNSFNHYAYGCVGQWLWESVAGIAADPAKPGFRHIIMRPAYGNLTISKACANCTEVYEPRKYDDDSSLAIAFFRNGQVGAKTAVTSAEAKSYDATDTGSSKTTPFSIIFS